MDRGELKRVLDSIILGCETSSAEGRQKAFEQCLDYADQHLGRSLDCNLFLAWAAERLGQSRVIKQVVQGMVEHPEGAKLHVGYQPEWGMVVTGNEEGMKYLSDLFRVLSESPVEGEFIKIDVEDPEISGESFGLVVFREDDEWFEQVEDEDDLAEEEAAFVFRRGLEASKVFGLQFLVEPPAGFHLHRNRVYLVHDIKKRTGDEIYEKLIREDTDRLWVFSFNDDNFELVTMALDLEDPEVNYLTRADMAQIIQ